MLESRTGFAFNNPDTISDYLAPSFGRIVTPDELRYDELFGNKLIAEADSQSFTDDQLGDYERLAIRYIEIELNIDILPRRIRYQSLIDENGNEIDRNLDDSDFIENMDDKQLEELYIQESGYPYRVVAARRECFIKLRRRPVRNMLTAILVDPYFSETIIDLMPYRVLKKGFSGICYFRPRLLNTVSSIPLSNMWFDYFFSPFYRDRQNIFLIDYETGYTNCMKVPDEFRMIIKKIAALTLMNTYGDGKLAAIAGRSVSLAGVSESISTTMSATSATYGARILQYQKEIKTWLSQNKAKYSRTLFGNL